MRSPRFSLHSPVPKTLALFFRALLWVPKDFYISSFSIPSRGVGEGKGFRLNVNDRSLNPQRIAYDQLLLLSGLKLPFHKNSARSWGHQALGWQLSSPPAWGP